MAAGIYSCLPLGYRELQSIKTLTREEIGVIRDQEMPMPIEQSSEQESIIWPATIAQFGIHLISVWTHAEVAEAAESFCE